MKLYQRIVAAIFTVSLLLASYTASTLAQSDDEVDDVPAFTPTTEATAPSLRIEIGTPEATSTPTLLPTETSTLEPEPSATTLLPTETSTAEPTSGTTETETPLPTNTPGQTSTPVVTATTPPAETNTPQPTETLEPQPTSTPKETVAPETSPTPEPSPTSSSPTVGIILLQGRNNHGGTGLVFSNNDCTNISIEVPITTTDSQGRFEITATPEQGNQHLCMIQNGYLTHQALNPNAANNTTILLGGDTNNDNNIDIFDITFISSHFNTNHPAADINANGVVDIYDLVIAAGNYNK